MAHEEQIPVVMSAGIHNGTVAGLRQFGPQGLRIGGLNPAGDNNETWELMKSHRPEDTAHITVHHPDPQTARDIGTITRHTIWAGMDLYNKPIPPEHLNRAANYLRHEEGIPQEGPTIVESPNPPGSSRYMPLVQAHFEQQATKAPDPGSLTDEMTVSSFEEKIAKWEVVALGELQQPGGVGATQEFNPVVDGPNPEGPSFGDNASNSPEQEIALETWVNTAVDMLNRGAGPEEIIAQLSHDGCPDPQTVLERAQSQPEQDPVSDEIGQDPFNAPPVQSPTGEMESVNQQPPALAKTASEEERIERIDRLADHMLKQKEHEGTAAGEVWDMAADIIDAKIDSSLKRDSSVKRVKIANSSLTGVEIERYEDMWGTEIVKVALDDGGTMNVSPGVVQEFEGEAPRDPVSDIQQFIDGLPEVEPTRPHIEARIKNLELARKAVRSTISKAGISDQVKLDAIDANAKDEIMALRESMAAVIEESEMAYLSGQQTYRPHGLNLPGVEKPVVQNADWNSKIAEKAAIFVAELPEEMKDDRDAVAYSAARHAHLSNGDLPEFTRQVLALLPDPTMMDPNMPGMQPPANTQDFVCPMCGTRGNAGGTDHCPNPECPSNGGAVMGPGAAMMGQGLPQPMASNNNEGAVEGLFL